uniref:Uncharacterized protein n=1 Tax=Avena sativa TaxID=4498 RepID=A0ACD5X198_AVESA
MAKPQAGANTQRPSSGRSAAAARTTAGPWPSDPTPPTPTPTSIPRADPSSIASVNRSSVGSSSPASATDLPARASRDIPSIAKEVAKFLSFDDDSAFPSAVSMLQPVLAPDGLADLEPLVELPDPEPEDTASSIVVSGCPADAVTASADSTVTQVAAPGDSTTNTDGPLLTEMEHVLVELGGARGLSPRSKRLLTMLVKVADAELNANTTAAALRMRRTALWRKVRVGILAATVFSVAVLDVALVVALFGARHGNSGYHHVLPPT